MDCECAENGPLEDVQPTEGVPSESPPQFESERTAADGEPEGEGEVEPDGVFSRQADRALPLLGRIVGINGLHYQHATAAFARQKVRRPVASPSVCALCDLCSLRPVAPMIGYHHRTERTRNAGEGSDGRRPRACR